MRNMTKKDLVSGMFGRDDSGDLFVVAGDKLVYECGLCDCLEDVTDDLTFVLGDGASIVELIEANSFKGIHDGNYDVIWDRSKAIWKPCEKKETEEVPVPKGVGKDASAITITEDQFFEAVKKANDKFMEIGKKTPGSELMEAMMGLQNITFGAIIGSVLFDKEIN